MPRGESIVSPGSHCPRCGTAIPAWRNIPILTWLVQRGRCHACGGAISARYVLVEAFTALLGLGWALAFSAGLWPSTAAAAGWLFFAFLAVPIALIDWEHFIIPDGLNLTGFVGALALHAWFSEAPLPGVLGALRDACLTAGGLYLVGWLIRYGLLVAGRVARKSLSGGLPRRLAFGSAMRLRAAHRLLRRYAAFDEDSEGLGLGDVNLMIPAGALFGPVVVLLGVLAASFLGLGGYAVRAFLPDARETALRAGVVADAVPFGPFLCAGILIAQPFAPAIRTLLGG